MPPPTAMNHRSILITLALTCATAVAAEPPKFLEGLLSKDTPVKGQIGAMAQPVEIDKYIAKVEAAARANKEWFTEFLSNAKPGMPLPYHEKLGLTKEEHAEYLKLWNQREFKVSEEVMLLLRQSSGDTWTVTATGRASTLSTLRYDSAKDVFRSPNGELKRIEDIKADASSVLGAWNGREWRFEEETSLGKTKENIAFGRYNDNSYGLIVYRAQEMTVAGTRLLDKSIIIRVPLSKTKPKP